MSEWVRAAFVIARRDYVASVWSKTFLFFLVGPLLPIIAGLFFGTVGADVDRQAERVTVALAVAPADGAALVAARDRLAARLGEDALPGLRVVAPETPTATLLADTRHGMVLVARGEIAAPLVIGPRDALTGARGALALIYDDARRASVLGQSGAALPAPTTIATHFVAPPPSATAATRITTARIGQFVLMLLAMILAGMLLSNLIEEKSSKVIEVLAAAVPVDAIFLGKLLAMLGMSLTGIAIWGGGVLAAVALVVPASEVLSPPAVGWPAFLALGLLYFVTCYLLLGALFLGIGAQASTVREVQTLSMPVTMAQLGVVAFASSVVGEPDSALAVAAMLFPWSSPFAMIARAAQLPGLWAHLIALVWQGLWVALIIRFAAARFRASVLKSGRPKRRRWRASRAGPSR